MIERLILSAVLGAISWGNPYSDEPIRLTPHQLRVKAIEASKSEACKSKKKSPDLKRFCDRRQSRS